jgi:UDP-2-acetamido-3-amino-2,3-dideoxy-glucuronate N-acetyltransferase
MPKIWQPSNVYKTVKLGKDVNVGAFSEIGPGVTIGSRTRIGKGCFIPEGSVIGKNCFLGPHVCMTNDRFPPSHKENWEKTIIEDGARIGAGVTIVCGVTIGRGALIGAGSVVTKNIPAYETWAGVPAKKL